MKYMFAILLLLATQTVLAQGYTGMDQGFQNPFQDGLSDSYVDQPVNESDWVVEDEEDYILEPEEQVSCPVPSAEQIAEDRVIAKKAYEITDGACDFRSNPHSYACTHATFDGLLFPFFPMDWWGQMNTPWNIQGAWFAVTYVENNGIENDGEAFYMEKNPNSSAQPMGVMNRKHGPMKTMEIRGDVVIFENWQGKVLVSDSDSLEVWGNHATYRMNEEITNRKGRRVKVTHYFDCVNFNRHENMHLQCRWDVKMGKRSERTHMGYFGFLTVTAWEKFLTCGKR